MSIERANSIRVAVSADRHCLLAVHCGEDKKLVVEMDADNADKLTLQLIEAGFGKAPAGKRQ